MSKSRRTSDLVNSLLVNADNSVNIHEGTQSPYFQLDTLATPMLQPGMFGWNDIDGTADLRLKGGNVTLQLGQETVARVVNKTGANLLESEYKVVRVRIASEGGAQGQRLAVVLAQGNNDPDSVTTLGIVTENIDNNQEGFITVFGNVSEINTTGSLQGETWVDGDVLFLSPTTPGALTKVKPTAPNHTVIMGYVVYAHAVHGKIFVKVDNGYELEELHDVLPTPYVDNGVLYRDTTANLWKSATIATLLGGSPIISMPTLAQVTTAGNITSNSIEVGGLTTTGNRVVISNLTGNGRVEIYNNVGTRDVDFIGGGFKSILYGNVAIGSNVDAGYKLDVNGTVRIVGDVTIRQGAWLTGHDAPPNQNKGILLFNSANGSLEIKQDWVPGYGSATLGGINFYTNGSIQQRINSKGNVLIGTTTDSGAKFQVTGSITASSAIARGVYFNNTLVAAANNDVLVGLDINPTFTNGAFTGVQNWGLRVQSSNILLSTTKGIYFGNSGYGITGEVGTGSLSFYTNSTERLKIDNAGAITAGGSARFANVLLTGSNIQLLNGLWYFNIENDGNGLQVKNVSGSNTVPFRIFKNDNVAIGTTTDAGYKLQVVGNIALSGNLVPTGGSQSLGTFTNRFGDVWAGGLIVGTTFYGDNLQSASGNLYFKEGSGLEKMRMLANGNFLIGTTTDAGYRVDVSGTLRSTADAYFATASGNVGVGTVSPQYKFDVRATSVKVQIRSTAESENATLFLGTPFNSSALPKVAIIAKAQSSWSRADLYFCVSDNSSSNTVEATTSDAKMVILSAGNVGIGNTAPSYKLDVSGDVNTSGVFRVGGVAGWTGIINIPTNPPGQQNIQVSGGIIVNVS